MYEGNIGSSEAVERERPQIPVEWLEKELGALAAAMTILEEKLAPVLSKTEDSGAGVGLDRPGVSSPLGSRISLLTEGIISLRYQIEYITRRLEL